MLYNPDNFTPEFNRIARPHLQALAVINMAVIHNLPLCYNYLRFAAGLHQVGRF